MRLTSHPKSDHLANSLFVVNLTSLNFFDSSNPVPKALQRNTLVTLRLCVSRDTRGDSHGPPDRCFWSPYRGIPADLRPRVSRRFVGRTDEWHGTPCLRVRGLVVLAG